MNAASASLAPGSTRGRSLPRTVAFAAAAGSFVLVFATAGAPIPLFNTYRAADGITKGELGMVSVGYFAAAAFALLVLGRLSNHLGRRSVALAALASSLASCMVLVGARGLLALVIARVLQGLACGLAPSALGSYVVDTAPAHPRWLPAVITGSAPMVGIPLGALTCGALVEYGPLPRTLVYLVTAVALVASATLVAMSPETMPRRAGAIASLRPRLRVPAGSGRLLVAAGAAFIATWSLGGFYQAFAPSVTAEHLGTTSPLVAATMFSSVMVLNPVFGPATARLGERAALRLGMILFVLALGGILVSLRAGAFVPLVGSSLAVGLAQGAASTAGLRALLASARLNDRAGLLSTLYLVGYGGAAIPGTVAGALASRTDLFWIAVGYGVLGTAAALVAAASATNPVEKE